MRHTKFLKILIAGGSPENEKDNWDDEQIFLDNLRKDYNVKDLIEFLGSAPHEKISTYFNAAGVEKKTAGH